MKFERAIIIRDKTRLEQLIERFNSKAQAAFYIESSGGDFAYYEQEHKVFYKSLETVKTVIGNHLKFKNIYRSFLPNYIFTETDLIIVVGQDGLVANTAKYVDELPIIGINPDPDRYDGVLLKHTPTALEATLKRILKGDFTTKAITMAKASLNDGQSLYAFNDFYIGADSHVSARYKISFKGTEENQSSSGIIVSTGAGSTGWLSSIFNMAHNVSRAYLPQIKPIGNTVNWDANKLIFVVREPFKSKMSSINIGYGEITSANDLTIESHMPSNGIIFSDGIESDFMHFNAGAVVKIGVATKKALLVA